MRLGDIAFLMPSYHAPWVYLGCGILMLGPTVTSKLVVLQGDDIL